MNNIIEHSLRQAFSQLPRADFDYIADAPIEKMPAHDAVTRLPAPLIALQKPAKFAFAGLAAAFLLIVSIWGWQNRMPYGLITLDVNPGFEITLNRQDIVLDIKGVNEEAQGILEGQNYRGWAPAEAVSILCTGIAAQGYMNDDNVILVSGYIPNYAERMDKLLEGINDMLNAADAEVRIYTVDREQHDSLRSEAEVYGFTLGKMQVINELANLYPELPKELLAEAKLSDLIYWAENGYQAAPQQEEEPSDEASNQAGKPEAPPAKTDIEAKWADIKTVQAQIIALHNDNQDGRNTAEILRLCDELEELYEALGEEYESYYTNDYREYYRGLGESYKDWGQSVGDYYEAWGESVGDAYKKWAKGIERNWRDYFN